MTRTPGVRALAVAPAALVATAGKSPDGTAAVERAFGDPLAKVEARWRVWMTERGEIDDRVSRGDASLGISAEDAGDGARIRSFVVGSAARAGGLRIGDVIFSVAGTPVRNRDELMLAVARLKLGEAVEIRYRRDEADLSAMVTPRPLGR
jgi:S1-C subfamily serine protease